MKLKLPYYKQETKWSCGPASLQMAMSFLGEFSTQDEIIKKMNLKLSQMDEFGDGIDNEQLVAVAQKMGFYCYVNQNTTVEEIKYFINLGLPVIVNYIEPREEDGHFSVVHGYGGLTQKKIILHDPFNGKNLKLSEKKFLGWWKSGYQTHTRWMLVLSKKPFKVGRQYDPIKEIHGEGEIIKPLAS